VVPRVVSSPLRLTLTTDREDDMCSQHHEAREGVCLPAGMVLVVPPPAPEEAEGPRPATGCSEGSVEPATVPALLHRGARRVMPGVEPA
jgi:hypothetical protein